MKRIIQAEEVMLYLLSIAALYYFKVPWWYYIILIIGPDISMLIRIQKLLFHRCSIWVFVASA
jgi:hypothetical protein